MERPVKNSPQNTRLMSSSSSIVVYRNNGALSNRWDVRPHELGGARPARTFELLLRLFLPAQYPTSVATGYASFTIAATAGAVAGSAAMVLSTQTLLLAIGVAGSSSSPALMAGALNWVLKDGIGQFGGVLFASQMGKSRHFDDNPKKWRMTAALALDTASLLEILAPWAATTMVLPIACIANVLKNIGFLTASASRAALHQSLAQAGNLADVTAKAGAQSMAAGLTGTAAGIGLSYLLAHDLTSFVGGFIGLSVIHQVCNYVSLQSIVLCHLNRNRLSIVLQQYVADETVLSPEQVAAVESYLPLMDENSWTKKWLSIGDKLLIACPEGSQEFQSLTTACQGEQYILNLTTSDNRIRLVFFDEANGEDLILGLLHAFLLKNDIVSRRNDQAMTVPSRIQYTHSQARSRFPGLLRSMRELHWKTDATSIEAGEAVRLRIEHTQQ